MSSIETIADYGDECGEGPLWNAEEGKLYWTDIPKKRFYGYCWKHRRHKLLHEGLEISGFAFLDGGGFAVVSSSGFWLWTVAGDASLLAQEADGRRCVMNDCIADPKGRLFSGSCFYDSNTNDYELGCLFCLDLDGTVHVVDEGFHLANGLGFSTDRRTLYFTDSAARTIYAYDYREADAKLSNRRVFVQGASDEGIPDGLTVDAESYVWSAQWFGGCIVRYDPDGKSERRIPIPATQTSSLTFGGPELTDIFVTTAGYSDALPLAPRGYNCSSRNVGGQVFHLNLGIAGREEYRVRVPQD